MNELQKFWLFVSVGMLFLMVMLIGQIVTDNFWLQMMFLFLAILGGIAFVKSTEFWRGK